MSRLVTPSTVRDRAPVSADRRRRGLPGPGAKCCQHPTQPGSWEGDPRVSIDTSPGPAPRPCLPSPQASWGWRDPVCLPRIAPSDGARLRLARRHPNWRCKCRCRRRNIWPTAQLRIGAGTPRRGSISTSSWTMQPPSGSSSRVRSCRQTLCHQLDEDSRKPPSSGRATSSTR